MRGGRRFAPGRSSMNASWISPKISLPALVPGFDGTIKTTGVAHAPSWGSHSGGPLRRNSDRLEATPQTSEEDYKADASALTDALDADRRDFE